MTEHLHRSVTSVTGDVQSIAQSTPPDDGLVPYIKPNGEQVRVVPQLAAMWDRMKQDKYGKRLKSEKPKDKRWAEDERAKADMEGRRQRRSSSGPVMPKNTHGKRFSSRRSVPLEKDEQRVVRDWLRANGVEHTVSLSGVRMDWKTRIRAMNAGMKKGDPDICITSLPLLRPLPPGARSVYIEMKRQKPFGEKPSQEQTVRINQLRRDGHLVNVCYGADEAIAWLVALGYGR